MTRTILAAVTAGFCLTLHGVAAQAATYVYVSNAEDKAITSYSLDRDDGKLVALETTPTGGEVMPLALSADHRHLYATLRSEPQQVLSYAIDAATGKLVKQGSGSLPASMANVDVDPSGRYLFAASYSDDLLSVSPIDARGVVEDSRKTLPTGKRAHAMHASPNGRYAYATNLGADQLVQYRFDADTGSLTPLSPASVSTPSQTGPRHFVFSPNGRFVYVLGEFSGAVTSYAYDERSGQLTALGTATGIPADSKLIRGMAREDIPAGDETPRIWAADIHTTPDGRFVYISERTRSRISAFRADPDTGELTFLRTTDVEKQPRGFNIDESGHFMVVSGQLDDEIGLYRIAPQSGELERVDEVATGKNANWVEIVTFGE